MFGPLGSSGERRSELPGRGLGGRRSPPGPRFQRLPHGFLDGSSRSLAGLALLRPSLSGEISGVPRRDLPGPPSNSAAPPLAHANSSFLGPAPGCGGESALRDPEPVWPEWANLFMPSRPGFADPPRTEQGCTRGSVPPVPPGLGPPGDRAQPHKSPRRPPGRNFMNEKAARPPSCAGGCCEAPECPEPTRAWVPREATRGGRSLLGPPTAAAA